MASSLRLVQFSVAIAALAALSCGAETPSPAAPPPATEPSAKNSTPALAAGPATSASVAPAPAEPPKPNAPTTASPVAQYSGFAKPESILYDADGDRYLVSNINGSPFDKDNNGFISVLSPDGQVATLKWIEGGKNNVKLDAPKGLAISKGVLYAADLTVVRMFDLASGGTPMN